MRIVQKITEGILVFLTSFTIAAGVLLAFVNVAVRFLFNTSIEWAFELTTYIFIYSSFFAAAYLFRKGANIKITLLLDLMPPAFSKITIILVDLINIIYLAIIAYFSYLFIFDPNYGVKASGEVSVDVGVQMWIVYLVLPISAVFGIMMVIFKLRDDLFVKSEELVQKEERGIINEELEEFGAE